MRMPLMTAYSFSLKVRTDALVRNHMGNGKINVIAHCKSFVLLMSSKALNLPTFLDGHQTMKILQ